MSGEGMEDLCPGPAWLAVRSPFANADVEAACCEVAKQGSLSLVLDLGLDLLCMIVQCVARVSWTGAFKARKQLLGVKLRWSHAPGEVKVLMRVEPEGTGGAKRVIR